jgi:hypothetical protein
MDTEMSRSGTTSLRIQYEIAPGGWGDCGTSFDFLQDWSAGEGISFWLYTDSPEQWVTLMLFSGDAEAPTPLEHRWQTKAGWTLFAFAWSSFSKAEWADASGLATVDPSRITGYGFSIVGDQAVSKSTMWIDDLALATGEMGQTPQEPAPTPTTPTELEATPMPTAKQDSLPPTATVSPEEPPPTTVPEPVEPEPAESGKPRGGLCGSAVILPLIAVLTAVPIAGKRER